MSSGINVSSDTVSAALIINESWGEDHKAGIPAVNRALVRLLLSSGVRHIYSTALRANTLEETAAKRDGVKLIFPNPEERRFKNKTKAHSDWLFFHDTFFPNLNPENVHYEFIFGYSLVTAEVAKKIKKDRFSNASLFFVNVWDDKYLTPKLIRCDEGELSARLEDMSKWYILAHVLSVGKSAFQYFANPGRRCVQEKHCQIDPVVLQFESSLMKGEVRGSTDVDSQETFGIFSVLQDMQDIPGYVTLLKALEKVANHCDCKDTRIEWRIFGIPYGKEEFIRKKLKLDSKDITIIYKTRPLNELCNELLSCDLALVPPNAHVTDPIIPFALVLGVPTILPDTLDFKSFIDKHLKEYEDHLLVKMDKSNQLQQKALDVVSDFRTTLNKAQTIKTAIKEIGPTDTHRRIIDKLQELLPNTTLASPIAEIGIPLQEADIVSSDIGDPNCEAGGKENIEWLASGDLPKGIPCTREGDKILSGQQSGEKHVDEQEQDQSDPKTGILPDRDSTSLEGTAKGLQEILTSASKTTSATAKELQLKELVHPPENPCNMYVKLHVDHCTPCAGYSATHVSDRILPATRDSNEGGKLKEKLRSLCSHVEVSGPEEGCIQYMIKCHTEKAAMLLWQQYQSGRLRKLVQKTLITRNFLRRVNAMSLTLQVSIEETSYQKVLQYFKKNYQGKGSVDDRREKRKHTVSASEETHHSCQGQVRSTIDYLDLAEQPQMKQAATTSSSDRADIAAKWNEILHYEKENKDLKKKNAYLAGVKKEAVDNAGFLKKALQQSQEKNDEQNRALCHKINTIQEKLTQAYPAKGTIMIFGSKGSEPGQYNHPSGIAANDRGELTVADKSNRRVQVLTWNNTFKHEYRYDDLDGPFRPRDVAVSRDGSYYCTDHGNMAVLACDEHNKVTASFGGAEGIDPYGITLTKDNAVLANDRYHDCIRKYTKEGSLIDTFGSKGKLPGQFDFPWSVVVNSENKIIVSDQNNHRVQVLDPNGKFLFLFGSKGSEDGQLINPHGIDVDDDDNIYVCDFTNNRVVKFSAEGKFIANIAKGRVSPRYIAVSKSKDGPLRLAVTDWEEHCIKVIFI
ncbi:uncharacterized protein LOC144453018 isoform X2 [Glandiceps talaboti]